MLELIGNICWYGMFITPLLSFLFVRRSRSLKPMGKFWVGIFLALVLAAILFAISMSIAMKDGLGPV